MTPANAAPASALLTGETIPTSLVHRVLASKASANTKRSYAKGIASLQQFAGARPIDYPLLLDWRAALAKKLTAPSVNVRLCGVRSLFREAMKTGDLSRDVATELGEIQNLPFRGQRSGNWLDRDQLRLLLVAPDRKTKRGKRDYCILAILAGCALRRYELAELELETLQQRDGRWVFADLVGKGGRVRTVPVPIWVKHAIDAWTKAAAIKSGPIIRRLKHGDGALSDDTIWEIVRDAALSIGVANFGPHDLRRTCAKLCRSRGGRLEQIQMLLGHASIQTTERYLGSTQNLKHAVNDDLGLW